jgi:hypothetical protein
LQATAEYGWTLFAPVLALMSGDMDIFSLTLGIP